MPRHDATFLTLTSGSHHAPAKRSEPQAHSRTLESAPVAHRSPEEELAAIFGQRTIKEQRTSETQRGSSSCLSEEEKNLALAMKESQKSFQDSKQVKSHDEEELERKEQEEIDFAIALSIQEDQEDRAKRKAINSLFEDETLVGESTTTSTSSHSLRVSTERRSQLQISS